MVTKLRIWKSLDNDIEEILRVQEKEFPKKTNVKLNAQLLLDSERDKESPKVIDDLDIADEDILILELL